MSAMNKTPIHFMVRILFEPSDNFHSCNCFKWVFSTRKSAVCGRDLNCPGRFQFKLIDCKQRSFMEFKR